MNQNDFERLNFIFERSFIDRITTEELREFNQLIDDWSASSEFHLLKEFNQATQSK